MRSYKIREPTTKLPLWYLKKPRKELFVPGKPCARSCPILQIVGNTWSYIHATTPQQKIEQVRMFGEDFVESPAVDGRYLWWFFWIGTGSVLPKWKKTLSIPLMMKNYRRASHCKDWKYWSNAHIQLIMRHRSIGGGGLAAGLGSIFKHLSPQKIIGGARRRTAMKASIEQGYVVTLPHIENL